MATRRKSRFRKDDVLGRYPVVEMSDPEAWLLDDAQYEKALRGMVTASFPDKWFEAERRIRSDRAARILLMSAGGSEADASDLPDDYEVLLQLLAETLPYLPEALASHVKQVLGEDPP